MLNQAGFVVQAQVLREPDGGGRFPEKTQQGFVLAVKPHCVPRPGGIRTVTIMRRRALIRWTGVIGAFHWIARVLSIEGLLRMSSLRLIARAEVVA